MLSRAKGRNRLLQLLISTSMLCSVGLLKFEQESRAVAREPRDAAAVVFGLKFADNIHYKFKSIYSQASKPAFRSPNIPAQKNRI